MNWQTVTYRPNISFKLKRISCVSKFTSKSDIIIVHFHKISNNLTTNEKFFGTLFKYDCILDYIDRVRETEAKAVVTWATAAIVTAVVALSSHVCWIFISLEIHCNCVVSIHTEECLCSYDACVGTEGGGKGREEGKRGGKDGEM